MAQVESVDIPMYSNMTPFTLPDAAGRVYNSWECFGVKGLLVVFTCNHCPYALAQWPRFIELAEHARQLGVNMLAINPNIHPNYPQDAPQYMRSLIVELGIVTPYLVDGTQQVARQFRAQCTPDPYLFNSQAELVYHGRLDDHWQDESAVTSHDLLAAVEALAAEEVLDSEQHPAVGCSIKWRQSEI